MADQTGSNDLSEVPDYMLTTYDNPFDPFTQWDEWYVWDMTAGYNTPGLLERVSRVPEDMPDTVAYHAIQRAIDEIVTENVSGMHKKVKAGDMTVANRG